MSIDKAKLRSDIIHEFGIKLDDMLESARSGVKSHEGGKSALTQARKSIEDLSKNVDEDVESGKLEEVAAEGALKLGEYVKRWVLRAAGLCDHLATKAEVQKLIFEGRADALAKAVSYAKEEHDKSMLKVYMYEKAMTEGQDPEEALRPQKDAATDLAERRAEAKARKEAEASEKEKPAESEKSKPAPKSTRKKKTPAKK